MPSCGKGVSREDREGILPQGLIASLDHVLDLLDAGLLVGRVSESLIIGERAFKIISCIVIVVQEHIAEPKVKECFWLLIVIANIEEFLIERNGLVVLLEVEMALGVRKIVDRPFMW